MNVLCTEWTAKNRFDYRKENRKPKNRKKKKSRAIKMERKKKLLRNTGPAYRNFKRGTEIPERKIRLPRGAAGGLKCFSEFSERKIRDIKRYWSLGSINAKEFWVCVSFTSSKTRKSLNLFHKVQLKKGYFILFHFPKEVTMIFSP